MNDKINILEKQFNEKIKLAFEYAKTTLDDWSVFQILLKMNEEYGELSENILFETGQIQHKKLSESLTGEIADCLIMLTHYSSAFNKEIPNISIFESKILCEMNFILKDNYQSYKENFLSLEREFSYFKDPMTVSNIHKTNNLEFLVNKFISINNIYTHSFLKNNKDINFEYVFIKSLENIINTMDQKIKKWEMVEEKK